MGSSDTFEEGLDFILQQRENDLADLTREIEVQVTRNQAVCYDLNLLFTVISAGRSYSGNIIIC